MHKLSNTRMDTLALSPATDIWLLAAAVVR